MSAESEENRDRGADFPGRMLHQAAIYNNTDFLADLLKGDEAQNIDERDHFGRTALYTAVTNNSLECARLLLQAGADPNIACGHQCGCMTPLHAAALEDKHTFLALLLRSGAAIEAADASGERALDLAVKNRSQECIHIIMREIEHRDSKKQVLEKAFYEACLQGDATKAKELAQNISKDDVKRLINNTPDGQNSLLYKACEWSNTDMVEFLSSHGAEGQVHPVTGQSPLHAACLAGQAPTTKVILQHYPELVQSPTIDGTLPLHIVAAEGHHQVASLILNFLYPENMKSIFRDENKDHFYRLGFSVNAKDGRSHSPLHVACMQNQPDIIALLLNFRVKIVKRESFARSSELKEDVLVPEEVAGDSVSASLNPGNSLVDLESPDVREATEDLYAGVIPPTDKNHFCPVEVDALDLDGCTPLHLAVKGNGLNGYHQVAQLLLENGAKPNKPIISPSGNSTALMEACISGDVAMMDLLLKHKAQDTDLKVLSAAVLSQHDSMAGTLLKFKSFRDSEYKINKQAVIMHHCGQLQATTDTYDSSSSTFPSTATAVNWHALRLNKTEATWLQEAALLQNSHLRSSHADLALFAITRIDISNNSLTVLPKEMFTLKSLRLLNVSENQLSSLPGSSSSTEGAVVVYGMGDGGGQPGEPSQTRTNNFQWDLPVLEEVQLNKNKLKVLPPFLFRLPSLKRLNASQNELERLPFEVWLAPSLLELNLSRNSLRELPVNSDHCQPLSETSSLDGSVDLNVEDQVSSNCSVPSTPKKGSFSTSHGSSSTGSGSGGNGTGEGDGIIQEEPPGLVSPARTYTESSVDHINYWEDKLRVQASTGFMDSDGNTDHGKLCPLQELNLAHNQFDGVPTGLACLAPLLSKLNLANNRLSHVGALSLYPATLKILDISHNRIFGHVLFECARFDDEQYTERWALRTCYNPSPKKQRSQSSSSGRLSLNSGMGTPSPLSVPPSPRVNLQGSSTCSHRSHTILEHLKTLKIDHNKLNSLTLSVDTGVSSTDLPNTEELQKSPSKTSLRRISGQSDVNVLAHPHLLYPGLSVLNASHNMLSMLPIELSDNSSLSELKLSHNKIKELPPEMGLLRKLWNLDLSGNPVERLLLSLLGEKAKKTAAVLGYLKSIKDEATLYNRMKLMFVGVQGIGKTSLLNQLRREGRSITNKPNKNWAQRMGHGSIKDKDLKGDNISTVGVDISDLILQRGNKEIIFRTWDFGGQKEYYATHQYFLSKRSLYLVCWRVTDGEKGVLDIMQWLVNIQARAPNSAVIIVGTHLDQINKRRYPPNYLYDLQALIFDKYLRHSEPDKWGLPRVIGNIEISCKPTLMSRSHISDLVNLICTVAFEEQWPGSKGVKLVEQKVPASYVHLQDVVTMLAEQRKAEGKDPVLHTEQYRMLVMSKMEEHYKSSFRDIAELNQATQFLHENGVLLHYDDVSLQDVYFLDPQWLCDMMANVVTIREINSLAKSGIMRTADLRLQFKNAAFKPEDIKTYIIDLLNKFEVALLWDEHNLLIPSLLPAEADLRHGLPYTDIRIPVLGSQLQKPHYGTGEHIVLEGPKTTAQEPREEGRSTFYINSTNYGVDQKPDHPSQDVSRETKPKELVTESHQIEDKALPDNHACMPKITHNPNPAVALVRLYLMSYFPSGFWPRLITRLLGDSTLYSLILSLYNLPDVLTTNDEFMRTQGSCPEWKCWQTGLELRFMDIVLARLKEAPRDKPNTFCDYRQCQMVMRQEELEGGVALLNLNSTSVLEVLFPNESITVHFDFDDGDNKVTATDSGHNESIVIQPSPQVTAGLLAKIVDHIDTLLEDWYPDLGARFIQNSRGMYLITRVVPCTRCILQQKERQEQENASTEAWSMVDLSPNDQHACITEPVYIERPAPIQEVPRVADAGAMEDEGNATDMKAGSAPTGHVTGTWVDSVYNSGFKVVQTVGTLYNRTAEATGILPRLDRNQMFVFTVEQCILAADLNRLSVLQCPRHGLHTSAHDIDPILQLAPDVVFQDIGDHYHIDPDQIWLGPILGRGAFGAVFAGSMVDKRTGQTVDIAMKMLQPVDPGQAATPSQKQQYNAERQRWEKDPMKNACEAYLNARKELSILLALHDDHIVPLLGIALQPLCLVLSLAPQGALSTCLREYRRTGARLPITVIQKVIIQVASALAYLHSCQIIYRDLKSENVLVWSIPLPSNIDLTLPVNVKLADYGVSRAVLPSGAKGFAGTPPFIAPEIIQHNGEESYTEKVDCFSFGMFIYELLMLRLPFEEGDSGAAAVANLKGHILSGGRPPVTPKELRYPSHTLDLMTLCWSHDPGDRPSAEQIRDIASGAPFCHLQDVVAIEKDMEAVCACAAPTPHDSDIFGDDLPEATEVESGADVWVSSRSSGNHGQGNINVFTYHKHRCVQTKSLSLDGAVVVVSMCLAGQYMWLADSTGIIHIFRHSDYTEVLKFPVTTTPNVHVRSMVYGWSEKRVFVVLDTGRLVVCGTSLPSNLTMNYTPVRTECPGNGKPIHCLASRPTNKGSSELWCGQARGRVSVWNLHTTSMKVVSHPDVTSDNTTVVHLVTDPTTMKNSAAIWSYVYPGTEVYRWNANSRTVVGRLDVSKVIPTDDPDAGMVVEGDHISAPKCQVSTMCVVGDELYVATTWGCILIADNVSMKPIMICRSHSDNTPYIRAIVPLVASSQATDFKDDLEKNQVTPGLVSIGKGYRNLISCHMGVDDNKVDLSGHTVLLSWATELWKYDYTRIKHSET